MIYSKTTQNVLDNQFAVTEINFVDVINIIQRFALHTVNLNIVVHVIINR